jgi:sugar (glycoside-pentoside-hexuronide) transporter
VVERTSLSSYRFVFAMLSQLVIQALALPMVKHFGQGNDAHGYQVTMGIFSALAVVFFVITFLTTTERVRPDPAQRSTVRQDFGDLLRNGPWLAMFALTIVLFVTLALRGGVMLYYFKYFVRREDLFSLFNVLGTGSTIVGVVLSKPAAVRLGKRKLFIIGLLFTVLFTAAFVVLPPTSVTAIMAMEMLRQFAYGFTIPLLWAMMADVADYSEWLNGRRATAIVFSAIIFGLKAGLGVGGAIGAYLLSLYGYVPNAVQSPHALDGIRYTASIFPAFTFLLCVLCLLPYRIDKKREIEIDAELTARRRRFAPAPLPMSPTVVP